MKYKDPITGEYKTIHMKTSDTLPVGTIVSFEGDEIPEGYEEVVGEEARVVISTTEPTTGEEVWIQKGKNLFNKKKALIGYELVSNEAGIQANAEWYVSDFISVTPGVTYFLSGKTSGTNNIFYDVDKNKIDGIGATTGALLVPDGIKYMRFNGKLSEIDTVQLEQGTTATSYEPYVDKKIFVKNDNGVYEEFYKSDIVESGSNENGKWIKYADGRMECYGRFGVEMSITSEFSLFGGTGHYYILPTRNFPQAFTQLDCFVMNLEISQNRYGLLLMTTGTSASLTKTASYLVVSPSPVNNDFVVFDFHAIGRWK